MAPPKQICSIYAEVYALYARLLTTIAEIRLALSRAIRIKNSVLYGTLSVLDAATAELVAASTAVASAVTSQIMSKTSSVAATALEAVLAPLLKILMSGPETVFGLVALPLNKAIAANNNEQRYLSAAKSHLDTVIAIFSKWTVEFGGGKYANKMYQALPYIESAIRKCSDVIDKLNRADYLVLTAQFDEATYNSMRGDIATAIEITKSDPVLFNTAALEERIRVKADAEAAIQIAAIRSRYKSDRQDITDEYNASDRKAAATAEYMGKLKALDAKRKVDIEVAQLNATKNAVLDKSIYSGLLTDIKDQFIFDMNQLGYSLRSFLTNLTQAYVQYKLSQSLTVTTYNIRALINKLISSMIKLLGSIGNGVSEGVERVLLLARSLLESTQNLYQQSLDKFNSTTQTISSTSLATNLAAGHGMLMSADRALAASITDSLIDAINADEALTAEQTKMNLLFVNIEAIHDWDGEQNVWGTKGISQSAEPPYVRLIAATTGLLATMASVGMVPNDAAISAMRHRLSEVSKTFRSLIRHNAEVSSALNSYRPTPSPYIAELEKAITPEMMSIFLIGTTAFNILGLAAQILGDAFTGNTADIATPKNCKLSYAELFEESSGSAEAALNSLRNPPQFNSETAAAYEQVELKRINSLDKIRKVTFSPEGSGLAGVE